MVELHITEGKAQQEWEQFCRLPGTARQMILNFLGARIEGDRKRLETISPENLREIQARLKELTAIKKTLEAPKLPENWKGTTNA